MPRGAPAGKRVMGLSAFGRRPGCPRYCCGVPVQESVVIVKGSEVSFKWRGGRRCDVEAGEAVHSSSIAES